MVCVVISQDRVLYESSSLGVRFMGSFLGKFLFKRNN